MFLGFFLGVVLWYIVPPKRWLCPPNTIVRIAFEQSRKQRERCDQSGEAETEEEEEEEEEGQVSLPSWLPN